MDTDDHVHTPNKGDLVPEEFDGQTTVFGAPVDWDRDRDGFCGGLPIQRVETQVTKEGSTEYFPYPYLQSCWGLTWKQRLRVLLTGKVWMVAVGSQIPISLHSDRTFPTPEE